MNQLTKIDVQATAFGHLLPAETFAAWRVIPINATLAFPVEIDAASFEDIVQGASCQCSHKDFLLVQRVGPGGKATLFVYTIKRESRARYEYDAVTKVERRWHKLYSELLFSLLLTAPFAPAEPFRWSPGCDVVGRDRSVVEAGNV